MDVGQVGMITADPLDFLIIRWNLGDLGPCFPWGSIISGSGCIFIISDLWMLNCLPSDINCLPSDCDIFLFFLLHCAVSDFIGSLHFVMMIMFAVAFYMIVLLPYVLCFAG